MFDLQALTCYKENLMEKIGNYPTLFFLDPYGLAPIKFKDMEPIFERIASTEIIMNFSRKGLQRLAGNLEAQTTTKRGKQAADTKVKTLTEVLNTDEWKAIWLTEHDSLKRDEAMLDLYMDQLNGYFSYVCALPIRSGYDTSPKYFLIYTTRKYDGVELINDFVFDIEACLFDKSYPLLLQLKEKELETELTNLKAEICDFGKNKGQTTRRRIRQNFLPRKFGLLKLKHYNRLVKKLWKEGKIRKFGNRAIRDDDILRFV
jgi:hypothetical protein